jgi:putative membrane protein
MNTTTLGSPHVTEHLANERTLLAWVRTGIGLIALGFVVSRFGLYLRELAPRTGSSAPATHHSALIGAALVALGILLTVVALHQYRTTQRQIEAGLYRPSRVIEFALVSSVAVGGLAMFVLLL